MRTKYDTERGSKRQSMGFLGDDQRGAYGRERLEPGPRAWYGSADEFDAQRGRGPSRDDDVERAYGGPGQQYGGRGRYDDRRVPPAAIDAYGRGIAGDYAQASGYSGTYDRDASGDYGHRGRGPKNYARSDERIREDVCDRLADDAAVDASDIEVDVKQGIVTLTGSVDARPLKRRAELLAEQCGGVDDVQNQLTVKSRDPRAD